VDQPAEITNSIGMKLVLIPPGEFTMGSKESPEELANVYRVKPDANNLDAEHPQHRVWITHLFYLGANVVTRGQFRSFVNDTGYKTDAEKDGKGGWGFVGNGVYGMTPKWSWRDNGFPQTDQHAVVTVSWNDAEAFCQWLSRKEGKAYRLPTEAEWEYACRAGSTSRYYFGDDPNDLVKHGWFEDKVDYSPPVIGTKAHNAWGLYEMHHTVLQWCNDWFDARYYTSSPVENPKGPKSGNKRVLRGGCFAGDRLGGRSASRDEREPDSRAYFYGFRVARTR
jgi:formylglycine-generating enzyme required for sulfatase activity